MTPWDPWDHQFIETAVSILTLAAAICIGWTQNQINTALKTIQDTVEIYGRYWQIIDQSTGTVVTRKIELINVGSRIVYLDRYSFNGKIYQTDSQLLAPANQPFTDYLIDLPSDGTNHISLEVFYRDIEGRNWKTSIFADEQAGGFWKVNTRPKVAIN